MMGGSDFKVFEGALVMETAADPSFKTRLVVCLQRDTLIIVGTRLIGAHLGGWAQGTRECVTAIAFNQPELVFLAFGAPDVASGPSDSDEFTGVLPKVYECLDTTEGSNFAVNMMSSTLQAAPFTGQHFLDTLPDSEVECLQTNLPAPVFATIADAPSVAGGELQAAPPELLACISAESLGRIPSEILTHSMGVTSEASRACVLDFASAHGQYVELVQGLAAQAGDVSSEDSLDVAEGGERLINCLTDEELEQFQEKFLPTMLP